MIYFKHPELSEKYHVSLKTIHNWIDAAKQGKVPLKLHSVNNRTYIANTPENTLTLMDLADKGKKYRNTLHHKVIEPKPEFYEIYNNRQILDIITNLSAHREIPLQYNYLNEGAVNWDNWAKQIAKDKDTNHITGTVELIKANMNVIDKLLENATRVNLIDLGLGNAYPSKDLAGHLIEKGLLHRYIGIDISQGMLDIAERNLKEWHGEDFPFEGYVRDMTHEQFDDLLVEDMLHEDADRTINLVVMFGGTANNFRSYSSPFRTVYNSIGTNDLMIHADKPDTEASRRYFNFTQEEQEEASAQHKYELVEEYILELLNIDPSLYKVEMGFDATEMMRYIRVRFQASITINFNFGNNHRPVNIDKGETILLLRVKHLTTLEMISEFQKIGFHLLQSSLTKDRQYFLTISGLEKKDRTQAEA